MLAEGEAEHGLKRSRMLAEEDRVLRWQCDGGLLSRSAGTIRRRARPLQVPALYESGADLHGCSLFGAEDSGKCQKLQPLLGQAGGSAKL